MLKLLTGNQSSVLDKSKLTEKKNNVHSGLPHTHFFGLIGLHYFNNNSVTENQKRKQ